MGFNLKHFSVLIVDDERRFANMLAKRLILRGYFCDIAYEGRSALDMMEQKKYHMVLLDLRLPDMNGVDILALIKKKWPATIVIIITGHGTEKDQMSCMALKADAFLHKPLKMAELLNTLEAIGEMKESSNESTIS
jgi:DNA-binding response OmpR family regulator